MRGWLLGVAAAILGCAAPPASDPAGMLLVGNKGENTLSLIALGDGSEIARLPTGPMPHEIAVSPDGGQAAVVAHGGSSIDVFDLRTRARLRTIELAPNQRPHGLVWLSDGRLVATCEGSKSVVVVMPSGEVKAIPTGSDGSHMIVVAPGNKWAFVANIRSGTVSVLDLHAGTKLRDIVTGGQPEGVALARGGSELWVGDLTAPRVQVFSSVTGERLGEVAIDPVAIRVAATPDGMTVVTSNVGAGTISVIDVATRRVTRTIRVSGEGSAGQVTLLFSRDGKRLYAAETGRNQVAEIDFASGTVIRRLNAGKNGDGLGLAPSPSHH